MHIDIRTEIILRNQAHACMWLSRTCFNELATEFRSFLYTWYRFSSAGFQVLLRVLGWQLGLQIKSNVVREIK